MSRERDRDQLARDHDVNVTKNRGHTDLYSRRTKLNPEQADNYLEIVVMSEICIFMW